MICPTRTSSQVLIASRLIAAELVAEAMDPAADLTAADRRALARLALAVDVEALRRVTFQRLPDRSPPDAGRGTQNVSIPGGPD